MMQALGGSLPYAYENSTVWTGPAVFERIQHFKDCGVPGTVTDPFNQFAIADGSCRAVGFAGCGCHFLKHPDRVKNVLEAVKALPSSDGPSHMVLTAQAGELLKVCNSESEEHKTLEDYDLLVVGHSLQNWWRALCSKDFTPFDPAYMPQQQALTLGFLCTTTCAAQGLMQGSDSLNALNMDAQYAGLKVQQMCTIQPVNFELEDTILGFSLITKNIEPICGCQKDGVSAFLQ